MGCCDKRGTRERDMTSTTTTTHQRTVVDDERLTARPRRSLSEKTSDTACAGTNCALSSSRCTHAGHAASFLAVPYRCGPYVQICTRWFSSCYYSRTFIKCSLSYRTDPLGCLGTLAIASAPLPRASFFFCFPLVVQALRFAVPPLGSREC